MRIATFDARSVHFAALVYQQSAYVVMVDRKSWYEILDAEVAVEAHPADTSHVDEWVLNTKIAELGFVVLHFAGMDNHHSSTP